MKLYMLEVNISHHMWATNVTRVVPMNLSSRYTRCKFKYIKVEFNATFVTVVISTYYNNN